MGSSNQLNLTIAGDLVSIASSRIDVSALGYASARDRGLGGSSTHYAGSGGGHGGLGGVGSGGSDRGGVYDSVLAPVLPGSGGGNGYFSSGGWGGGWFVWRSGVRCGSMAGWWPRDGGSGWGAGWAAAAAAGRSLTVGPALRLWFHHANGGAGAAAAAARRLRRL